ncbi:intestinal mucin-like protein [Engystomops pustulosus]|uniref:intestinal mucin-like protein n=1 Tax=Engystomops pustulosus TaxID=76066 RepID=UPI003AFA6459
MAKVYCPEVEQITCVGGSPPIKIYDQNGCCFYYECTHCVGPHGIMKKPGDAWIDNCRYCKCDSYFEKDSMKSKISCQPLKCPPLDFNACEKPWLTPYFTYTEEDRCCPRIHCLCEPFYCEQQTENCSLGYEAVPSIMEGECCATINCKPMDVCIQNGSIYQIGQEISVNRLSCKQCRCSGIKDLKTGFNTIVCESILCMKHCPQGFAYEPSNDGCCGTCIQESCIVIATDGSRHLLKPGESQFLLGDNCTEYTCELSGKTFMTSSKTKVCTITNEEECTSGSFEKTPDGCCSICRVPQTCTVKTNVTTIFQNGCSANVSLSYCEGWCPSSRKFSEMSLRMEGECVCCLEVETTEMEIELICPGDMDNVKMTLLSASTCACSSASCTA